MRFLLPLLLLAAGCASADYPKSDHYDGHKFFNPNGPGPKSLWEVLKWQMTKERQLWPASRDNVATPKLAGELSDRQISTTFINHASHLLQYRGVNILTDPVFSERTSPFQWMGPKRARKPGLEFAQLPRIDAVVISHNHYDHMDEGSIRELAKRFDPVFIVPLGNGRLVKDFGAKKIVELDWWQETNLPGGASVILVPALHWSRRGLFDTNDCLWGGYVFRTEHTRTFFSGDTGYGDFFKKIRERLGPMDLSFIAIGAYEPRWFMKGHHMNPEDAVQAHIDLESKRTIGTHFGTFQLTDEGIDAPAETLKSALQAKGVPATAFTAPDNGQTTEITVSR